MDTPICDFIRRYAESDTLRAHMPGHKGHSFVGVEKWDITEIAGADSLFEAQGIIRQSEHIAGELFGCHTLYSTEGSSQCIRAMLYLAALFARERGVRFRIAAGRNVHKAFLSAAALLDAEVVWLYGGERDGYLSCHVDTQTLEQAFAAEQPPTVVYLTSPDYLGGMADIRVAAEVCHRHGALLLCDNAHGAYLKFLPQSWHPIDMGVDICCDSAHKTLPALTGGAYLHISRGAPAQLVEWGKTALAMFGSTSPSYLILQSLDRVNHYLADGYSARLSRFVSEIQAVGERLDAYGYTRCFGEPLKFTLAAKPFGYTGTALAAALRERGVECEFADPDFLVLMLTPETGANGLERLERALTSVPRRPPIVQQPPRFVPVQPALSIREAALSPWELLPVERCNGRVLASASVGCPPAVPIAVCGERLDTAAIACFRYYGITECAVVRETG